MDIGKAAFWRSVAFLGVGIGSYGLAACMAGQPASPGAGLDASTTEGADSVVSTSCPDGGYPSCPAQPPSWGTDVQAIVEQFCFPCHDNGGSGTGNGNVFTTTGGVRRSLTTALTDLHTCTMPPDNGADMPPAARETLLEWLACDGPDN